MGLLGPGTQSCEQSQPIARILHFVVTSDLKQGYAIEGLQVVACGHARSNSPRSGITDSLSCRQSWQERRRSCGRFVLPRTELGRRDRGRGVASGLGCGESPGELGPAVQVELLVDVPEVVFDGLGRQVHLGGDFLVAEPVGGKERDPQLLPGQRGAHDASGRPAGGAGGSQFTVCAARPWKRLKAVEGFSGGTELLACGSAMTVSSQPLAIDEPGASLLERVIRRIVGVRPHCRVEGRCRVGRTCGDETAHPVYRCLGRQVRGDELVVDSGSDPGRAMSHGPPVKSPRPNTPN